MLQSGHLLHYASFRDEDHRASCDLPVVLVHGNCQAESLRLFLRSDDVETVRIPPVHELTRDDLPHLAAWLARADLLVSQPVHDGYRGLPLGTAELTAQMPPGARVVCVPVIRFAGLYPTHAIVRPPSDRSLVPPLVAYHDLRVLAEAAGRRARVRLGPETVRAIGVRSLEQLRLRERAHRTVVVSDLLERSPDFTQMRTLNHPGNAIWEPLAERVRAAAGLDPAVGTSGPGRPVLDAIHAPRLPEVIEAYDLGDDPDPHWHVDGRAITTGEVREAHLRWYAEHPDAVDAGLTRHAEALDLLGLGA